jgi:heterotetrameric sarcosine oxidase delta subunit
MLKFNCPFCGERDESEFRCGGQAHLVRPGPHSQVSDETWAEYLFMRDNPLGWHRERWLHVQGCRQWFNVLRHTATHQIQAIYSMTGQQPAIEGGVTLP